MKWIIGVFILLFVLGCGQQETLEGVITYDPAATTTEEDIVNEYSDVNKEDEEVSYVLSVDEEALLKERFTVDERIDISRPLATELHEGETLVLGLGLRNILGQTTHDFVLDIDFVEMRDYSNSMIDTDDDLLEAWFSRSNLGPYTLERTDEVVVPLIIEVGGMITADDALAPGNYIFDINVNYVTN
jgi:hypothetical protein